MSLNWNLGRIKDWETVCQVVADTDDRMNGVKAGDELLAPVTRSLIWATMAVDLGSITEANAGEFFARLRTIEATGDAFLRRAERQDDPANWITLAEVRAHIGLSTNVTTQRAGAWWKRTAERMEGDAKRAETARAAKAKAA